MGTENYHDMSEAFGCDVCGAIFKGKPHGIIKLRKRGDGVDGELCESCYNMIVGQVGSD